MSVAERGFPDTDPPDVRVMNLFARQQGVAHRSQLLAAGLSEQQIDRRLRSRALVRVLPAVYRHGSVPESWLQRLWAAQLWAREGAAISHEAAGAVWKLDGCRQGKVVLATTRSLKAPTEAITVHRVRHVPAHHVTSQNGLRVTTPARTLFDLASALEEADLEEALDCALRRRSTSLQRLEMEMRSHVGFGHTGRAALGRLLRERSPGYAPTHSVLETRFRRLLKRNRLPLPAQQQVIRRRSGGFARVDFVYPAIGLVIEVDGFSSHGGRSNWEHDLKRQNDLVVDGLRVLRFTWRDLHERETQVVRTLQAVFTPGLPLGPGGL